jgi:hypothetical protein
MRKRVSRHIEQCEICGERKRRELTPALFAGALPLVALMPGFREHVLKVCADTSPAGLGHRAAAATRAGEFGPAGFPRPTSSPGVSRWHQVMRHSHALAASGATAVAAAGISAVLILGGGGPSSHAPGSGARGSAGPGLATNGRGPFRGSGTSPGAKGSGPAAVAGSVSPTALGQATSTGSHPAPGTSGSATSTSGSSSSGPTSPAAGSSSSAPAAPGTLTVSLSKLVLVAVNGHGVGTFALTAQGGPVSYTISAPADLAVSPASGSLAAGASATITVTSSSLITLDEQLTINPGGYTVTVVLSVSL